jgi:hypothetical protein
MYENFEGNKLFTLCTPPPIPNKLQPLLLSFSQPEFLNHWEKEFRALDKKKNK